MGEASPKIEKPDPLVGRTINGRFEVLQMVARGGMGRVYRAKQQPLGREVALKVLDPRQQGDQDAEFQQRFFLEASTAAKLSHPNTVTVFDYGKTDDDIFFIVMEFVEGHTMSKMMKECGAIEPQRAVHICMQIARSLREAHGLGVIHRDLKPANVLLTKHADEDDFVKVLDFGLVKNVEVDDELTQAGLFMGSPKYMAPEQIQGEHVDGRTDVYALGVILYHTLTGRVPFDRDNQVQTLMAHMREAVPPMTRDDGVEIPHGLQQVTMRCLAKSPDDRFASMQELITALKHASSSVGMNLLSSGSFTLDMDASGMRTAATPGDGFPSGEHLLSPSGGIDITGEVPMMSLDGAGVQEEKKSKAPMIAFLLLAILGGGAAAFFATQGETQATADPAPAPEPVAEVAPEPEPEPEVEPEPEPEPAAPVIATVVVNVTSDPPGAALMINGENRGTTPASVELTGDLAEPGTQLEFQLVKAGYLPGTATRVVTGSGPVELSLSLARAARRPPVRRPSGMASMASPMMSTSLPSRTSRDYHDNPY